MSSLFSALTAAVSGVSAQSSALSNISDNISNANTTGYKGVSTNFSTLVTASSSTSNNAGGVAAIPQYNNDVQGSVTTSSTNTNLAISGAGYFAVETATSDSTGATIFTGSNYYTRKGDFTLDKNGYLINGSGYYLLGYTASTAGVIDTAATAPIQISAQIDNPVETTSVTYTANLPSSASTSYASSASSVQLYDSLGNTHEASYTWTKSGNNAWSLAVSVKGGSGLNASGNPVDFNATIPFSFNTDGTPKAITSGSNYTVVDTSSATEHKAQVSLGLSFAGANSQTVALNFGDYNTASGLTQYSDSTVSVTSFEQNGLAKGQYSSLSIDSSGVVSVNYTNGSVRTIAQVPIVQFYAQDNLQRVTGNAFQATLSSGSARFNIAGSSGAGTISSSSIEASNVDTPISFRPSRFILRTPRLFRLSIKC